MKCFAIFKILGIAGCLAFLTGQALADINVTGYGNGQIQAPEFVDAPSGNMLKFNYSRTGDQSSLGTCTMNPMSSNVVTAIIEELPVKETETYVAVQDYTESASDRRGRHNDRDRSRDRPHYPGDRPDMPGGRPGDNPGDNPSSNVPEPATMLIMGMGIAGIIPLRRYLRRK